jgi:tetratricopeptide (TPR) repeat protein
MGEERGLDVQQGQQAGDEVARLEGLGAGDPRSPAFPALAEAHRRAGRAEVALKIAEEGLRHQPELVAGHMALALALLDLGRTEELRSRLSRVLEAVPDHALASRLQGELPARPAAPAHPLAGLDEVELEDAFEDAEADREEMIDANHVAAATLRAVEEGSPEGVFAPRAGSPFATETVAGLLEEQGHVEGARAIRRALAPEQPDPQLEERGRERVVATLERWLENLRRRKR